MGEENENMKSQIDLIDDEGDSSSTRGDGTLETEESGDAGLGTNTSGTQYGCVINLSYSWDPSSQFNYSSLKMKVNNSSYITPVMSSYNAAFTYTTTIPNITTYSLQVFYSTGLGRVAAEHCGTCTLSFDSTISESGDKTNS